MSRSIRWLSQSCFQLRTATLCVYTDPGLLYEPERLPKADLVLVTHHHPDHLHRGTAATLRDAATTAVGPAKTRKKLGPGMVIISPGESGDLKGGGIRAVHAYNPPGSTGIITFHRKGVGVGTFSR